MVQINNCIRYRFDISYINTYVVAAVPFASHDAATATTTDTVVFAAAVVAAAPFANYCKAISHISVRRAELHSPYRPRERSSTPRIGVTSCRHRRRDLPTSPQLRV